MNVSVKEEKGIQYRNLPKFNDSSYAHFVTTKTYRSYPYFKDEELCRIVVEELEFYCRKYGFTLIGYVIMPDHMHLLLWWDKETKPDLSISKVMQSIKGATARRIIDWLKYKGLEQMLQSIHNGGIKYTGKLAEVYQPSTDRLEHPLQPHRSENHRQNSGKNSHKQNIKYHLWQSGFYDFAIYSDEKLLEKLNYIHNNPVKTGLAHSPEHYKWSSCGLYFPDKAYK